MAHCQQPPVKLSDAQLQTLVTSLNTCDHGWKHCFRGSAETFQIAAQRQGATAVQRADESE